MGVLDPRFPDELWDGLSDNPERFDRTVTTTPTAQDWDRIAAEVLAVEDYILGLPTTPDGDKFSLYSSVAEEVILGGQWVLIQSNGELAIANNTTAGRVSGLSMTGGNIGNTIVYLRQGRIVSADWTNTIGSTELDPGADYYLTATGGMSVTAPVSGYIVKLGQAQNLTTFDIDINPSIKL